MLLGGGVRHEFGGEDQQPYARMTSYNNVSGSPNRTHRYQLIATDRYRHK